MLAKIKQKKENFIFWLTYGLLFVLGIKTLFHGLPDIERFFAEWMDERLVLTYIMKFGTLNFAPTMIQHPLLYHYLTFVPIALFYVIGKLIGLFHDKVEFVRFYFNHTHYFFLIGRIMSYVFYWLTAVIIFKIARQFYNRMVAHITALSYLFIPRFIIDFSTTRMDTLLFLNTSIFFYFFLKYYLRKRKKYLFAAAFVLGASVATKYNALYLGSLFIPLLALQLKDGALYNKNCKEIIFSYLAAAFLIFLGFFICNPFFIIGFNKYFHNFTVYSTIEAKYYWAGIPGIFGLTHLKELCSFIYLNFFGFLILLLGGYNLFKKDKKLSIFAFFAILVYEIYFAIFLSQYTPLYYLNPLLPVAALLFGAGIDFIVNYGKKFMAILIIFAVVLVYNYFDFWIGLSIPKTYLQEARAYIEKNIPEFTTICITSNNKLPQLNMTEASYHHLIKTAPVIDAIAGHKLSYQKLDDEASYDSIFKKLRIESLTHKPQYNLIRWDKNIKTEKEARVFLKNNNIEYILGIIMPVVNNKKLTETEIALPIRIFKPNNKRIYGDINLYLCKVSNTIKLSGE